VKARFAAIALLALAVPATVAGDVAPRLTVTLEPTTVTVGDPITVTATVELTRRGVPASLEVADSREGEVERLDEPRLVRVPTAGGERLSWTFRAAIFRPGRFELAPPIVRLAGDPPVEIAVDSTLRVEVRSVLAGTDDADPAPPARPRAMPRGGAPWWTLAALAAVVVAAAIVLARRAPPTADAPVATALPPLAELERALAGLDDSDAVAGHAAVSRALRRYLGRTLSFPALESTTAEIARRLGSRGAVDLALARRIRRLLGDCDGVKFALRPADAPALAVRRGEALAIARELALALAPAAPPVAPGGEP
jgi:hypothetical protein